MVVVVGNTMKFEPLCKVESIVPPEGELNHLTKLPGAMATRFDDPPAHIVEGLANAVGPKVVLKYTVSAILCGLLHVV